MKKIWTGIAIVLVTNLLAGCSQIHFSKDAITIGDEQKNVLKKNKKKKVVHPKIEKKKTKVKSVWNKTKYQELQKIVNNWGRVKKQHYHFYDGVHFLKTKAGVTYPKAFDQNDFVLNKEKIKIGWSPEGKNTYQYNVVAIANDNFETWHNTYLFCLRKNKPIILLDQSKRNKLVLVKRVNDPTLNKAFKQILEDKQKSM